MNAFALSYPLQISIDSLFAIDIDGRTTSHMYKYRPRYETNTDFLCNPLTSSSPTITGLILDLRPANKRRCYFVTTSLTGWAQA